MSRLRRTRFGSPAAAAALLLAAACRLDVAAPDPAIRLVGPSADARAAYVEVAGADPATLDAVRRLSPTAGEWVRTLDVRVVAPDGAASETPVAGRYAVDGSLLRFTPLFPFDRGRSYEVRYYRGGAIVRQTVALPAAAPAAPTFVTHVYPSADVIPENQLRMYIHFSAPMGRRGALTHIKLLDGLGREVVDPFLPLEAEFWNADRTRYTVFFDPGRQKRGILPNRQMGPSLTQGRRYTLVVDREWIDGEGNPLGGTFTRSFRVGPADRDPLDPKTWRVTAPAQGTRAPLTLDFPEPLDRGLLLRAVGVRRDGQPVAGDVRLEADETRWTLTPSEAWAPGRYEVVALAVLEDLAGNRVGRAFEVEAFDRVEERADTAMTSLPFSLAPVRLSAAER